MCLFSESAQSLNMFSKCPDYRSVVFDIHVQFHDKRYDLCKFHIIKKQTTKNGRIRENSNVNSQDWDSGSRCCHRNRIDRQI